MPTIKRVPTVLSNYQDDDTSDVVGCGKKCLGQCCLPLSTLPLYEFKKQTERLSMEEKPVIDFLKTLVFVQWVDRMKRGLFRYDVTACETKVIPGNHGFITQLNEGRHLKKRPTEFRVDLVLQPFDPKKFNFTKIGQEEVLLRFQESNDGNARYSEKAQVTAGISTSVLSINVSPIEYGHVLLISRVLDCLAQRIDHESFLLALHFTSEAENPYFRVGYNSLGAFATINHLHFQAYYMPATFPVEKSPIQEIPTSEASNKSGVTVSRLLNYPVKGLVFEGGNTLKDLSAVVSNSCIWFQENNIPFNVLISNSGRKIFLFPQCYAEKPALGEVSQELLDTQVNPACWEIGGHMVLKRRKDFEEASEDYAWRLLAEVSLSEERFEEVKAHVFEATGLVEVDAKNKTSKSSDSVSTTNCCHRTLPRTPSLHYCLDQNLGLQ